MHDLFMALNSPSAPWLLLILCASMVYIVYLVKKGWVEVHTDKLTVGRNAAEREQVILRRQIEYVNSACNATMRKIPTHDKFDEWRTRFVIEKVIDHMVTWCLFNHIDCSERYVRLKAEEVWNIIQKYTWHELYQSDEFHAYIQSFTREVLENLVAYRKEFS